MGIEWPMARDVPARLHPTCGIKSIVKICGLCKQETQYSVRIRIQAWSPVIPICCCSLFILMLSCFLPVTSLDVIYSRKRPARKICIHFASSPVLALRVSYSFLRTTNFCFYHCHPTHTILEMPLSFSKLSELELHNDPLSNCQIWLP